MATLCTAPPGEGGPAPRASLPGVAASVRGARGAGFVTETSVSVNTGVCETEDVALPSVCVRDELCLTDVL